MTWKSYHLNDMQKESLAYKDSKSMVFNCFTYIERKNVKLI